MNETKRARYTLEFKMEAVRLVRGGQVAAVTAKKFLCQKTYINQ